MDSAVLVTHDLSFIPGSESFNTPPGTFSHTDMHLEIHVGFRGPSGEPGFDYGLLELTLADNGNSLLFRMTNLYDAQNPEVRTEMELTLAKITKERFLELGGFEH